MKSVKFFSKQKLQVDECPSPKVLTWGNLWDSGSAWEITALLKPDSFFGNNYSQHIVTMIHYSVRVVIGTILNDRSTVSSSSTIIIKWLLKGLVTEPTPHKKRYKKLRKSKGKAPYTLPSNILAIDAKKSFYYFKSLSDGVRVLRAICGSQQAEEPNDEDHKELTE